MKKQPFIALLILISSLLFQNVQAQEFNAGETLKFRLYYGFLNAGHATLSLLETEWNGQEIYFARAVGKTTGLTDKLYNVYDVYSSFFDKETCLPLKAIRDIVEGNYTRYNEVTYDHEKQYLVSQASGKHEFEGLMFDVVSAFYYMRRKGFGELAPGDILKIPTYFTDEFWDLEIRYRGKENVTTDLGTIPCYKFVPVVEPGRVFDREDDLKVWISDDGNFIPIRIQMDLIVGSFKADLESYSNLAKPLGIE